MILSIDADLLTDHGRDVSVAIVDSGFSVIPSYATLHGERARGSRGHGDRILSIFSSLDWRFPLNGLKLHLACYSPSSGYAGLASALESLPDCDILSISMLWKDDDETTRRLLERKFGKVCCPCSNGLLRHPSSYGFTLTCSKTERRTADFCIDPNPEWTGNSYAVPAVARLLAHGIDLRNTGNGIAVQELFAPCRNGVRVKEQDHVPEKRKCPHCQRYLRNGRNGFATPKSGICPYCGLPIATSKPYFLAR